MKGRIELSGMEFRAFHGCLPEERTDGNDFVVDVGWSQDVSDAAVSDSLDDTVDYSAVYDIVAAQMAEPSNLLENVAARIARAISERFPGIDSLTVSVAKKNPPVAGPAAYSKVTVSL